MVIPDDPRLCGATLACCKAIQGQFKHAILALFAFVADVLAEMFFGFVRSEPI